MRQVLLLSPIFRWGNQGSERSNNLPKDAQPGNGGHSIQIPHVVRSKAQTMAAAT